MRQSTRRLATWSAATLAFFTIGLGLAEGAAGSEVLRIRNGVANVHFTQQVPTDPSGCIVRDTVGNLFSEARRMPPDSPPSAFSAALFRIATYNACTGEVFGDYFTVEPIEPGEFEIAENLRAARLTHSFATQNLLTGEAGPPLSVDLVWSAGSDALRSGSIARAHSNIMGTVVNDHVIARFYEANAGGEISLGSTNYAAGTLTETIIGSASGGSVTIASPVASLAFSGTSATAGTSDATSRDVDNVAVFYDKADDSGCTLTSAFVSAEESTTLFGGETFDRTELRVLYQAYDICADEPISYVDAYGPVPGDAIDVAKSLHSGTVIGGVDGVDAISGAARHFDVDLDLTAHHVDHGQSGNISWANGIRTFNRQRGASSPATVEGSVSLDGGPLGLGEPTLAYLSRYSDRMRSR
jgi:hypothetical protein